MLERHLETVEKMLRENGFEKDHSYTSPALTKLLLSPPPKSFQLDLHLIKHINKRLAYI